MDPSPHALAVAAGVSFFYVGLRSFQQLNVTQYHYKSVFATSQMMAAADIFLIAKWAQWGLTWTTWLLYGTASGLGCLVAMYLKRRFYK